MLQRLNKGDFSADSMEALFALEKETHFSFSPLMGSLVRAVILGGRLVEKDKGELCLLSSPGGVLGNKALKICFPRNRR